mgnify:CR=1 FL=1
MSAKDIQVGRGEQLVKGSKVAHPDAVPQRKVVFDNLETTFQHGFHHGGLHGGVLAGKLGNGFG